MNKKRKEKIKKGKQEQKSEGKPWNWWSFFVGFLLGTIMGR